MSMFSNVYSPETGIVKVTFYKHKVMYMFPSEYGKIVRRWMLFVSACCENVKSVDMLTPDVNVVTVYSSVDSVVDCLRRVFNGVVDLVAYGRDGVVMLKCLDSDRNMCVKVIEVGT